jgi:hypothetical protein
MTPTLEATADVCAEVPSSPSDETVTTTTTDDAGSVTTVTTTYTFSDYTTCTTDEYYDTGSAEAAIITA